MKIGFELELSDIDTAKVLPDGALYCYEDATIVNSNGQGNDPLKQVVSKGSEVTSKICDSLEQAIEHFEEIVGTFPEATVNYRSNLHIHISDPLIGMHNFKEFAEYVYRNQKTLLEFCNIDILTSSDPLEVLRHEHSQLSRFNELEKSILDNIISLEEVNKDTVEQVMVDTSRYYQLNRLGINFRQLTKLGTVEFRCFNGTLLSSEFKTAIELCISFIQSFLNGKEFTVVDFNKNDLPKQQPFSKNLESTWRLTNFQHNDRHTAINNINTLIRYNLI